MYNIQKEPYTTDSFYKDNFVIRVRDFDEKAVAEFTEDFYKAEDGPSDFIPIAIDSYGGNYHGIIGMVDLVLTTKKKVLTYVHTKAMSAGIILAAFGTLGYRYASPSSDLLFHQMNGLSWGSLAEQENQIQHTRFNHDRFMKKMARHCGHPEDYFLNLIEQKKNLDVFMVPEEALIHKIIDKIAVPRINVERHTKYTLEV